MGDRLPKERRGTTPAQNGWGGGALPFQPGPAVAAPPASVGAATVVPEPKFLSPPAVGGSGGTVDDHDAGFELRYPALWEWVSVTLLQGRSRQPSTLLFFREEGKWKVCLCDRENERVLFRSGLTLEAALDALEAALCVPGADWRPSKASRSRR